MSELDRLLEEINLKNIDSTTIENIDKEDILSGCRTLDALHLSTAIELQKELGENLFIFSYDKEFNKVAKQLGFKTCYYSLYIGFKAFHNACIILKLFESSLILLFSFRKSNRVLKSWFVTISFSLFWNL